MKAMQDGGSARSPEMIANRYEIEASLHEGEYMVVYAARDTSTARLVALKVTRAGYRRAATALEDEGRLMVRADTPAIARLDRAGRLADGRTYIATEWIDGATLRAIVSRGALPLNAALMATERVCVALGALHRLGFIHRDVKPNNVMVPTVCGTLRFDRAVLIDLGECRELNERGTTGADWTSAGRVSGTVYYMAPEQLAGRPETRAADVFAIGILLFELLYGGPPLWRLPWRRVSLLGRDKLRAYAGPFVIKRLTEETSIPTSPAVPEPVRHFLARALRLDPAERPASADDALAELRAAGDELGRSERSAKG